MSVRFAFTRIHRRATVRRMTKLHLLGFFAILFPALGVAACSSDTGTPGTGGTTTSTGTAAGCTDPQATCGAACAGCGCPACAAFALCAVTGDCAQGTECVANIACASTPGCSSVCLPKHDGACDTMPCAAGQGCSPVSGENASYCFTPAGANELCDAYNPASCAAGLYCPKFAAMQVCVPQTPPGQTCDGSDSCTAGYYCSVTSQTCVKTLNLGQACMSFEACSEGLYCDLADAGGKPTCAASADPGQPCHSALKSCKSGKGCVFPAGAACEINHDCKDLGGACCAGANGPVCAVYSPSCQTPSGTCP
jgi:hypothetical protein